MTRFVHLTDIHLSDPATPDPHLYTDTASRLALATELIGELDPAPEFVAITGDLTNNGDAASYALLAQALERFEVPLVLALGNHDARAAFRARFDPHAGDPDAPHFHHARHGPLHVITLDSLVPGRIGGAIGAAQFEMLSIALRADPGVRKLILCHHPPQTARPGMLPWESLTAEDSARLAEMLRPHEVVAILCGHVHADRVLHWQAIPVIVSTGLHNTISVLASRETVFTDGAGFAICDHFATGLEVSFVPLFPRQEELGRIGADTVAGFR